MSFLNSLHRDIARDRRRRVFGILFFILILIVVFAVFGELPELAVIAP